MLTRYLISSFALLISVGLGVLVSMDRLPILIGILAIVCVLVVGLLLQIIVLMRQRMEAMKLYNVYLRTRDEEAIQRAQSKAAKSPRIMQSLRESHEKDHPTPPKKQITLADVIGDLRDSEAFMLEQRDIDDLVGSDQGWSYTSALYQPKGGNNSEEVFELVKRETILSPEWAVMLFVRLLFTLYKECTSSKRLLVPLPMRLINHPRLENALQKAQKLWLIVAKRTTFIVEATNVVEADQEYLQRLKLLTNNGIDFGLSWDACLLTANPALLHQRGVRFFIIRFETWISLHQGNETKSKLRRLSERMEKYDIAWVIDVMNGLASPEALSRQGARYMIVSQDKA